MAVRGTAALPDDATTVDFSNEATSRPPGSWADFG